MSQEVAVDLDKCHSMVGKKCSGLCRLLASNTMIKDMNQRLTVTYLPSPPEHDHVSLAQDLVRPCQLGQLESNCMKDSVSFRES